MRVNEIMVALLATAASRYVGVAVGAPIEILGQRSAERSSADKGPEARVWVIARPETFRQNLRK